VTRELVDHPLAILLRRMNVPPDKAGERIVELHGPESCDFGPNIDERYIEKPML
jgi:hypothetical protein